MKSLSILTLLLCVTALAIPAHATDPGFWLGDVGPLSGPAPHSFRLHAAAVTHDPLWGGFCLVVKWGDGETSLGCELCYWDQYNDECSAGLDEQHVYRCPGTYKVRAYSSAVPGDTLRFTVTVTDPAAPAPAGLNVVYANDGRTCKLVLVGELPLEYGAGTSIDWGDGSSAESFSWRNDHYGLETPYHAYSEDGNYTVRVISTFVCAYAPIATERTVLIPGVTTPVKMTTWGGIKALYR